MNLENKKQVAILALAVGLGLVAVFLTANHIQVSLKSQKDSLAKEFKKMDKARRKEMAKMAKKIQDLEKRQNVVAKRTAKSAQSKADSPEVPKSSLALRTPPGKRAMTLRIDSLSAVGGLINPGDFVDIMATLKIPPPPGAKSQKPEELTAVLFQNMQVLAVGVNLQVTGGYKEQQKSRALNITFAVDPEETGLLTFAQNNGSFQLVLRSPEETETQMLQTASWEALSEYVLDRHGMDLIVPQSRAAFQPLMTGNLPAQAVEIKPRIEIFRGGREL